MSRCLCFTDKFFWKFCQRRKDHLFKGLRSLVRSDDRIILCVYKRPTAAMSKNLLRLFLMPRYRDQKSMQNRLCFIREYALIPMFGIRFSRKGISLFWYDKKA